MDHLPGCSERYQGHHWSTPQLREEAGGSCSFPWFPSQHSCLHRPAPHPHSRSVLSSLPSHGTPHWPLGTSPSEKHPRLCTPKICTRLFLAAPFLTPQTWKHPKVQQELNGRTSLVAQWLRLHVPNAGGTGLTPGRGRSHRPCGAAKKKKRVESNGKETNKHGVFTPWNTTQGE